jgi:WD40 repeat protein
MSRRREHAGANRAGAEPTEAVRADSTAVSRHVGLTGVLSGTLAFDPAGDRLVTGGGDGSVVAWDVVTGQPIRRVGAHQGMVSHVGVYTNNGGSRS